MIVGITGSRAWTRGDVVRSILSAELSPDDVVFVGDARGVDRDAAAWCREAGLRYAVFPAAHLWPKLGKRAGPWRNAPIATASERLIAFWDGESAGTLDCIRQAQKAGKRVTVYGMDGNGLELMPGDPEEWWADFVDMCRHAAEMERARTRRAGQQQGKAGAAR